MVTIAKPEINRATCLIIHELNLTSWFGDGIRWKGVAVTYRVYQELVKRSYEHRPVLCLRHLPRELFPLLGEVGTGMQTARSWATVMILKKGDQINK